MNNKLTKLFKPVPNDQLLTDLPVRKLPDIMTITNLEKGKTPLFNRLLPTAVSGTSNTTDMVILSDYELDENPETGVFC